MTSSSHPDVFKGKTTLKGTRFLSVLSCLARGKEKEEELRETTTPIDLSVLEWEIARYVSPDKDCILNGFKNVFSLRYTGRQIAIDTKISSRQMICHI